MDPALIPHRRAGVIHAWEVSVLRFRQRTRSAAFSPAFGEPLSAECPGTPPLPPSAPPPSEPPPFAPPPFQPPPFEPWPPAPPQSAPFDPPPFEPPPFEPWSPLEPPPFEPPEPLQTLTEIPHGAMRCS